MLLTLYSIIIPQTPAITDPNHAAHELQTAPIKCDRRDSGPRGWQRMRWLFQEHESCKTPALAHGIFSSYYQKALF
jgi:hypothetical protein